MKKILTMISVVALSMMMNISAFAINGVYGWQKDEKGTWFREADGTWPANEWRWIPINDTVTTNYDGFIACYYFDNNGYLVTNTITPDGYTVNEFGMWVNDNNEVNAIYDLEMAVMHAYMSYTKDVTLR